MVLGTAPPLLALTVTPGWPAVVLTFNSMFGPRLVNCPQSVMVAVEPLVLVRWLSHHRREATLVSATPPTDTLEMFTSLAPWLAEPAGLSPGSQPAATGPTRAPLMVLSAPFG